MPDKCFRDCVGLLSTWISLYLLDVVVSHLSFRMFTATGAFCFLLILLGHLVPLGCIGLVAALVPILLRMWKGITFSIPLKMVRSIYGSP